MSAWPVHKLGDLAVKIGSGATPRGGKDSYKSSGTPLIRSMNVHFDGFRHEGLAFIDDQQARLLDTVRVHAGDVLLNITGASIGRVTLAPEYMEGARVNQHVCIIRSNGVLNPAFLAHFVASPVQQSSIMAQHVGVTRPGLTKQQICEFDIPAPPLAEQSRIVAEIEKQFSRLDAGVAALRRVEANLKRYKASVLKSACEGKLTEAWRAENADVEPASELLHRILTERRCRWEVAELAKLESRGDSPKSEQWKRRYKEPESLEGAALPDLPSGWVWTTLDALTYFTVDYRGKTPPTAESGIPVISAANVKDGEIVPGKKHVSGETYREWLVRGRPQPGDFVITTEAPVGETALFPSEGTYLLTRRVFACQTNGVPNSYLRFALRGEAAQAHLKRHIRGTTVPRILKPNLMRTPIPLPPMDEQQTVVESVERQLTVISKLVTQFRTERKRSARLRQSILKDAFEGKLVEQDPTDEPASKLLERIRAENERAIQKNGKVSRRKRKAVKQEKSK